MTTFTRTTNGKEQTRIAHTAAEAVHLRFNGWTEQTSRTPEPPAETPAATAAEPTEPAAKAKTTTK